MREALDALDGSKRRHPHLDTSTRSKFGQALEQVAHRGGELRVGVDAFDGSGAYRVHDSEPFGWVDSSARHALILAHRATVKLDQ